MSKQTRICDCGFTSQCDCTPPKLVNGISFFSFHSELRGYDFYSKHSGIIPKFILFYKGYTTEDLIYNRISNDLVRIDYI